MQEEPLADLYPVRERDSRFTATKNALAGDRRLAAQLKRSDLEDRFLRLHDEHFLLKKHAHAQEEKIKQLSTKLKRQLSSKKRMLSQETKDGIPKREVDLQEILEDREQQIQLLQKQNTQLKEKLSIAKQQAMTNVYPAGLYHDIKPRVDTGLSEKLKRKLKTRCVRTQMNTTQIIRPAGNKNFQSVRKPPKPPPPGSPPSVCSGKLLEEAYEEVKKLETMVTSQNSQIDAYEQELEALRDQINVCETEEEPEGFVSLKTQILEGKRYQHQENADLIRLQREMKQKSAKVSSLQVQYVDLEEKMKALKESNEMLLRDFDIVQNRLTEEQKKNLELHTELRKTAITHKTILELQQQVSDLQKENRVLRESNDKLINSTLDIEKNQNYLAKEKSLQLQLNQLEVTLKAELQEKVTLLEQLSQEKAKYSLLDASHKQLLNEHVQLKEKLEVTEKQLNRFSKGGSVSVSELEAALSLVHQQEKEKTVEKQLAFLHKVDDDKDKDLNKEIAEIELHLAETAAELEKTRGMLQLQYKINRDYQTELESLNKKIANREKEFEAKLEEYTQLLDLRNARIKKLERQLRDVAYGTKQYKLADSLQELETSPLAIEETVHLERGQNLFEIHVERVRLSDKWLHALENAKEISTFLTWEFYEFELQSTPVLKGPAPEFNCTSQYIIRMDDFLLHYLNEESITLELHQAFGMDYKTVAACQISCKDVLEHPQEKNHGNQDLIGTKMGSSGFLYGTVEYWIRLHLPAEETVQLYKERLKGLSYLESNYHITESALQVLNSPSFHTSADSRYINELHIKIIQCSGLKGKRKDSQPSTYCIYKFYNLPDQDTVIIPASNNPFFDDHRTFSLRMDAELDNYLRKSDLEIYVFDDDDPEIGTYLGKAIIPLLTLAHNKPLKGTFHLKTASNNVAGTIDVSLYWLFMYAPPTDVGVPSLPKEHNESVIPDILREKTSDGQESQRTPPVPLPRTSLAARRSSSSLQSKSDVLPQSGEAEKEEEIDALNDAREDSLSEIPNLSKVPSVASSSNPSVASKDDDEENEDEDEIVEEENVFTDEDEQDEKDNRDNEEDVADDDDDAAKDDDDSIDEDEKADEEDNEKDHNGNEDPKDEWQTQVNIENTSGSESAEVVILSPRRLSRSKSEDTIVITISSLQLVEGSKILKNPQIQMLFIEYQFLNYPPEELETPFALPKPLPSHSVTYNFRKVFHVDAAYHRDKRKLLLKMLTSKSAESSKIPFTIVSDPPENDQELDCEDVGVCSVDIRKILETRRDLIDEPVEIYDIEDRTTVIGYLNITIEALPALQAVIADV